MRMWQMANIVLLIILTSRRTQLFTAETEAALNYTLMQMRLSGTKFKRIIA